ncbi:class II aldolase/adducin family protein [Streptomyces sp. M19]
MNSEQHPEAAALLERSHRLGADPRNTNYAGGNTSAKGTAPDPVTGEDIELMWVKGSGGDLGTLTRAGWPRCAWTGCARCAGLPGVEREDEMVAAFDFCLHGKGGAAPSIDTAMHGLVEAAHVDHLHPDSGIALACAADGEKLTAECFGDRVVWVPWRRPGFQLGLDIAAVQRANPRAIGCVLGGHGITAWGATSEECERNSLDIIRTAERFLAEHGRAEPFGPVLEGTGRCPRRSGTGSPPRWRRWCGAGLHGPAAGGALRRQRHGAGLPRARGPPAAGGARHVLPRPLPAHQGAPAGARPAAGHAAGADRGAAGAVARGVPGRVPGLLRAARDARLPALRGADPAIVLIPGVGMFSYGKDKQTARVAGSSISTRST